MPLKYFAPFSYCSCVCMSNGSGRKRTVRPGWVCWMCCGRFVKRQCSWAVIIISCNCNADDDDDGTMSVTSACKYNVQCAMCNEQCAMCNVLPVRLVVLAPRSSQHNCVFFEKLASIFYRALCIFYFFIRREKRKQNALAVLQCVGKQSLSVQR